MFFFASRTAFSIATTTSQALPIPRPTRHLPSPITTDALNLNWRPQAVTRVTLSIFKSSSLNSLGAASLNPHFFGASFVIKTIEK